MHPHVPAVDDEDAQLRQCCDLSRLLDGDKRGLGVIACCNFVG